MTTQARKLQLAFISNEITLKKIEETSCDYWQDPKNERGWYVFDDGSALSYDSYDRTSIKTNFTKINYGKKLDEMGIN